MPTKVAAITCPSCKYTVFSRSHHDMRWCPCGEVAIDGGRSYTKVSYKKELPNTVWLDVPQTDKELYQDWNRSADKFGLFAPGDDLPLTDPPKDNKGA